MRRATKLTMTELDKGLACAARREGQTLRQIGQALGRDDKTLQRLFKRRGVTVQRERCPCCGRHLGLQIKNRSS